MDDTVLWLHILLGPYWCVCVCVCCTVSLILHRSTYNALDRVQKKAAQFTNNTKDSDWETLAQRRTLARLCTLFKAYSGERAWKAIRDRLRGPYYLSRVDHVQKIGDRKQRTDIRKYSFVNRIIKNWNQLPADGLGTFPSKPKIFRNSFRKAITNGVKWKE